MKAICEMTYDEAVVEFLECAAAKDNEMLPREERVCWQDRAFAIQLYLAENFSNNLEKRGTQ